MSIMEFWGVEVKGGQRVKVHPGFNKIVHLSQASLGESTKGNKNESVPLFLQVNDQKLVIGTLNTHNCKQTTYDLVFPEEFELSHNWENGSVYFCGYKSLYQESSDDDDNDDSSDDEFSSEKEEDITLVPQENDVPSKPSTDNANSKAIVVVEPIKEVKEMEVDSDSDDEEEDDSDDEEEDDSDDDSKSKVNAVALIKEEEVKEEDTDSDDSEDDSEDDGSEDDSAEDSSDDGDDDDDSSEDDVTPKKAEQNKKRPAAPAEPETKTPTGKKAKLVTPQKIGGEGKKTGGHIATPYPSKQAGKTSANKDKSKQQTPARDSHSKAKKHRAAK